MKTSRREMQWLAVAFLIAVAGLLWVQRFEELARANAQESSVFQPRNPSSPNGFDISNAIIPKEEILSGGPPRDGIPAIDKPRYPSGQVLSTETGFSRDYTATPYAGYEDTPRTFFPVPTHRDELENKEWVLGVVVDGRAKAYPIEELAKAGKAIDEAGGVKLEVSYDREGRQPSVVRLPDRQPIPSVSAFWFAWQAFYPQTELWKP